MKISAEQLAKMLDSQIDFLHVEAAVEMHDGDFIGALGFLNSRGVISDHEQAELEQKMG